MKLKKSEVYVVIDNNLYDGEYDLQLFVNREKAECYLQKQFEELKGRYEEYRDHRGTNDFVSPVSMIELGDCDLDDSVCDRYLAIEKHRIN